MLSLALIGLLLFIRRGEENSHFLSLHIPALNTLCNTMTVVVEGKLQAVAIKRRHFLMVSMVTISYLLSSAFTKKVKRKIRYSSRGTAFARLIEKGSELMRKAVLERAAAMNVSCYYNLDSNLQSVHKLKKNRITVQNNTSILWFSRYHPVNMSLLPG